MLRRSPPNRLMMCPDEAQRTIRASSATLRRSNCGPRAKLDHKRTTDLALRKEARSRTRTDDPFLTMEVLYRTELSGRAALTVAT